MSGAVAAGLVSVLKRIAETVRRTGRQPGDVKLILVSKTVAPGTVVQAAECGARDFGENRVQELLEKKQRLETERPELAAAIRWHMIGRLQTNKVKTLLPHVTLIHSLDRPELAREIEKQAAALEIKKVPCLIQVNSSGEASKAGFAPEQVFDFAASICRDSPLAVRGLMTIGPFTEDDAAIRAAFRRTRELREELRSKLPQHVWDMLSMGMSGDFETAIEEGATLVRIGTAVFGARM